MTFFLFFWEFSEIKLSKKFTSLSLSLLPLCFPLSPFHSSHFPFAIALSLSLSLSCDRSLSLQNLSLFPRASPLPFLSLSFSLPNLFATTLLLLLLLRIEGRKRFPQLSLYFPPLSLSRDKTIFLRGEANLSLFHFLSSFLIFFFLSAPLSRLSHDGNFSVRRRGMITCKLYMNLHDY